MRVTCQGKFFSFYINEIIFNFWKNICIFINFNIK